MCEHLVEIVCILKKVASNDGEHIITAPAPLAIVDGGYYNPGFYPYVVVSSCADSLPLYRIERMLA